MMFHYAMKAATSSKLQLLDRINKFEKLKMEPIIELFLSGSGDIFSKNRDKLVENCSQFTNCEYLVHFPIYDIENKYIYDPYNEEENKVRILLDFCEEINSNVLIMHRCYGFNIGIGKAEAEDKFLTNVTLWNGLAKEKNVTILIENYGFVWLPESLGKEYVTSPLDHFFPWDIIKFEGAINRLHLNCIGILLDIAHAVLSSNMFNMLKKHPELSSDRRFRNIYAEDLEKKDLLKVNDFIFDFIDYFHISDSFIWYPGDGFNNLKKYLYTENLAIGKGNINFTDIFKTVAHEKVMVMEINPGNGNYNNNVSQLKAIERFKYFFKKGDRQCA